MRTSTSKTKVLPPRNLTSAPVCVEPCAPPSPLFAKLATKQRWIRFLFALAASVILNIALWGRGGSGREEDEVKFRGGLSG